LGKYKNLSEARQDVQFDVGHVEPGEIAELPDFQADGVSPIIWPPTIWEPVPEPKAAPKSKAAG
jgi:hypothetical protein